MKNLLYKELRLALHPTAVLFIALSAMLLIPNYPYYIIFFYTSLGIFFICLTGRENHDIFYSMTLPVPRRQIVGARFLLALILEGAQLAAAIPFALFRQSLPLPPNLVGIDANLAFFGSSLILLGIFNYVFFVSYYRAPDKVGRSFIFSSAAMLVYILAAETAVHALPAARELDTPDPTRLGAKLILLALGAVIFALLTGLAYRRSVRLFEKIDL